MRNVKSKLKRVALMALPVLLLGGASSAPVSAIGRGSKQDHPEVPKFVLRTIVAERGQPKGQREQEPWIFCATIHRCAGCSSIE